mgnify:CR=1 FL=1
MPRVIDDEPLTDGPEKIDGDWDNFPTQNVIKSNAGFEYELEMDAKIKKTGRETSGPAGANSLKADLEVKSVLHKTMIKFELKEKMSADFAQLNLDYDTSQKKFYIDKNKSTSQRDAARVMIGVAERANVINNCNMKWKEVPAKFSMNNEAKRDITARKIAYATDLKAFPNFFLMEGKLAAKEVENYYNSKDTYYIQIKKKGLYFMGTDKYNIGCPSFEGSCNSSNLRVRLKANSKSEGRYSFLIALKISRLLKSTMDLDTIGTQSPNVSLPA